MADLWRCLTKDMSCDLAQAFLPGEERLVVFDDTRNNHRNGSSAAGSASFTLSVRLPGNRRQRKRVTQIMHAIVIFQIIDYTAISGTSLFIHNALRSLPLNESAESPHFNVHFHDAVDPNLNFDFENVIESLVTLGSLSPAPRGCGLS